MKSSIKRRLALFNYMSKKSSFKIAQIGIILLVLYGVLILPLGVNYDYFEIIINAFTFSRFSFILLFIFLITFFIYYDSFRKYDFYLIRMNNKLVMKKELIKTVLFNNLILFIITIMLFVILLNIFHINDFHIKILNHYNIYNFIYVLFFITRLFVWIELISVFNILVVEKFSKPICLVVNIIFYTYLCYGITLSPNLVISSIMDIGFKLYYFFFPMPYSSFMFEIVISVFYVLIVILGLRIFNYLFSKVTGGGYYQN